MTDKWALAANWDILTAYPNSATDIARFDETAGAGVGLVDMNGLALQVQDMYVFGTANGYDITDTSTTGDGLGTFGTLTIGTLTIGTLTHSATGSNTVSGEIDAGAISVSAGTLALINSGNTVGGAVNVASGATLEAWAGSLGTGTVTLNGGTATLSLGGADPLPTAGMAYIPITNDADSEISSSKTYTHAIDFGTGTVASINGVNFANDFSGNGSRSMTQAAAGGAALTVTGDVVDLFHDMVYNDMTTEIILTGLTPGQWYDVRMYNRSWGNGGTRTQAFLYDVSNDGSTEETVTLNPDDASAVPPGLAAWDTAYAMSYTYQAEANGTLNIHANGQVANNSLHLYGLTNEEAGGGPLVSGDLDMSGNDIVVTAGSTLQAIIDGAATFGGLTLTSGTLTIENSGTGTTVASVASDGATVGVTSTADVTSTGALTLADNSQLAVTTPNFTAGSTALGNNSALNFSGDTATLGVVSITGPAAGITVNSAASATSIELATGDTLTVGTSGAGTLSTTTLTSSGTNGTIALAGGMQMTAATLSNAGTGTGLNVTGSGSLVIDAADITVVPGMALGVGPDSTLAASNAASTSLNAATTTITLSGGTFETEGVVIGSAVPGLLGAHVAGNDFTGVNDGSLGMVMGPLGGRSGAEHWNDVIGQNNSQLIYTGQIYLTGETTFIECIDDGTRLIIDGETVIEDGTWNNAIHGTIDRPAGWYDVDIRFRNGVGGYGPQKQGGWSENFGFGIDVNGNDTQDEANFVFPLDPGVGSGTLFRVGTVSVGAIDMSSTNVDVNANSNLIATTDSTATFGPLTLNSGIVTVSGAVGGTTFGGASAPAAAVSGVTTDTTLALGALTIGAGADVTLGGTTVTATSIDLDTSAIIRVIGDVNPGAYNEAGAVALTVAGTGNLDMRNLGATAAAGTTFTTQETATLKLGGDTPLGGSPNDLNLAGGTIQIIGADAPGGEEPISNAGITATASTEFPNRTAIEAVDGTGMSGVYPNEVHNTDYNSMWLTNNSVTDQWYKVDLGASYDLANMRQWNYFEGNGNRGVNEADLYYYNGAGDPGNDFGVNWILAEAGHVFTKELGGTFDATEEIALGVTAQWIGLDIDGNHGGDNYLGLAELRFTQSGTVTGAINLPTTNLNVTDDSGLDAVTASTAAFGALSFNGQGILTTSGADGSISFTGTTITSAAGDLGFETLSDTYAGPIDFNSTGAVIIKTGAADLILDSSDPLNAAGAGFDVREGRLIAQAGSNPLGVGNAVTINGGEVVLVAKDAATDPTFDNPVTSTANGGTLTAGRDGDGFARTVTIGSGTNHVSLDAGGTLLMQTLDGYTLNVGGNVAGDGNMAIAAASTVTVAGTLDAGTVTIDGSLEVAGVVNVTDLIANTGGSYTGPSDLTVAATLTLNGDLDLSAATLVVDNANVTVNGGTLTVGAGNAANHLGSTTPVASVDLSSGGALALTGTSLTTKKLATTGGTFDMGVTGSFIATGDVTASPAAGPAQLQLTGGTLSIEGSGGGMPAGLQFHVNASDINNDGGATNPANGATVTNWADTSGNGNDAGNAWNAPVYNTAGPNGMPVVTFTDDVLSTTHNFNGLEGYTMITVAGYTGGRGGRVFGSMDKNFLFGFHGGTVGEWHAEGWIYNGTASPDTDFHLHVGTITNDADPKVSFWEDGVNRVTDHTGSHNTNYRMDRLALGGYRNNSETSNADIAEALIFEGVLSEEDINNIAGYLAAKYGLAGTGYSGSLASGMNLTGTDLLMSAATTLNVTSDVTLGDLTVDNVAVSPVILTFTDAADLRLNLTSTTFNTALTGAPGLIVDTTPKVNLGDLNLANSFDPVVEKIGAGELIITDTVTNYTGTATYNVNEGTLTLGDTGLIGSQVNVNDGTTLKLSSTIGDTTYTEPVTFSGDVTVLAGAADAGSTAAVITLPTINPLGGQTLTLGAEENYTLEITNPVSVGTLSTTGLGAATLDNGGAATLAVDISAGTLNVNNAAIVTPSISVTETGSLNLGVAQSTDDLLVDTSGVVNVPNALTVTDEIILGAVAITDDANMDIVGSNLADPTGTITVSGSSFDMGPIVVPVVAPAGAVALYSFESDAGGVTPNSGSGGAAIDGALIGDSVLAAGKIGQAMSFDGDGDYIDVEYDASLDMSAFTVSAWVNINSEPGSYGILGTRIDGDTTFDVKVAGDKIHADVGTGGGWISTAVDIGAGDTGSNTQGGDLAIGQWYQVTYVVDDAAKQFRLYIDGDLKRTMNYPNNAHTARFMKPGQSLWIGDDYTGHEYMDGLIDEVYIYDRALDGGEVTDLFNVGIPVVGGTVDIDMPNLALDLATAGSSATITLNDATPTLGDLTMGAVTDLTIAVADNASFNNVTVNAGGLTTINNGGAAPGLTVRGALQTAAAGGDLTTDFSVNGDLTISGAAASLNAVGANVTAKNFTNAGGTVAFDGDSSLTLTSSTLTQNGGTTDLAAGTTASGITAIDVTAGTLTTAAAITIETLNVSADATLSASAPVTVNQTADLGSLEIGVVGGSFGVSGSDVSDDAADRTVTLQGGTTTFSGSINGGAGGGGLSFFQITNNADSGIEAAKIYTHAIDFGNTGAATVDTVVFATDVNVSAGGRTNAGTRTYATSNHQASGTPPGVIGEVASVFTDCRYNGPDLGYVELTGLTEGQWYDVRLYDRSWGYQAGNRTYYAVYDVGGDGAVEFTTPKINQNDANLDPPNLTGDVSWAMSYVYQADATGKIKVIIDIADDFTGSYHLYGLTNELTTVSAGISLPTTTIAATETSTLYLGAADSLTLAGIDVSADKTLTVDCTSQTIALTNLTMGGGSMMRSTVTVTPDELPVDVTVSGKLTAGDGVASLGDYSNDDAATNLTLSDGAAFDWTFGAGADNYLEIGGTATIAGVLDVQLLDGGGTAAGADVRLMLSHGLIDVSAATLNVTEPSGTSWTWDSLSVEQISASDYILVLKNLVAGVVSVEGDANGDGDVDDLDLALFEAQFGLKGVGHSADVDGDNDVDLDDFVMIRGNFGFTSAPEPAAPDFSSTPEPATMSLLAIGGLLVLRRRRRRS